METLDLDTRTFAKTMAFALAIMHWSAGIDGNDIEFVIGSKTHVPRYPTVADFVSGDKNDKVHAKYDYDFRKQVNHIWLLDFNECNQKKESDTVDDWIAIIVKAFYGNDPYYPTPVSTDPRDQELWKVFEEVYLEQVQVQFQI